MNAFTNYLEKMGSNFLVASMVPSLGLVVACILVFDPILNLSVLFKDQQGIYQLIGFALLLAIPTIIIGFTLTALNTYLLKLFEGYVFLHRLPSLRNSHLRKATRLIIRRKTLEKRINVLKRYKKKTERRDGLLTILKNKYYSVTALYDQSYPPNVEDILPTQFGNILKAAELYPGTRYGIDAVQFWPRLIHVIPTSYKQSIDESRNELSFLVNMSTLSVVFYLLCLFAIFYNFAVPALRSPVPSFEIVSIENSFRYIFSGLIAMFFNWFFNKASLFSVGEFGAMIRSSYDLFRLDLLEQFRLKLPKGSIEEFYIWKNLGEFISLGQKSLEFKPLKYVVKNKKEKK